MQKLSTAPSFTDSRGDIIDLIDGEPINAATVVTFRKGAIRGNHYHKHTTQWNYVMSGKIKLVSQIPGADVVETILAPGDFVVTVPNERHALVAIEDAELMVFAKGPRSGNNYESDTFRLDVPIASQS